MKDQNGTVHSFSYDNLGRQTADSIAVASASLEDTTPVMAR
jgi:hypothetical protein